MVQLAPERLILHHEKAKLVFFDLLAGGHQFEFDEMLRLWFDNQEPCLVKFVEWLDAHGMEIRRKQ